MNNRVLSIAIVFMLLAAGLVVVGPKTVSAADTITITTPKQYQMFQRNTTDKASITITGTYSGTVVSIEADFNGGGYSVINNTPAGGVYTGTLTNCALGQGVLTVRFSNNISCTATKTYIGVGDVYVIAGQSNAEGRATEAQYYSNLTYNATVFKENDVWALANDPIDVSTASGCPFPVLAGYIMDNASVPVCFITTAEGSTGLYARADWQKGGGQGGNYENMWSQVNDSGVNAVKAVLFHQGEYDAYNGASYTDYKNALIGLADNITADLPGAPNTYVAQIGGAEAYYSSGSATQNVWNITRAQQDAWNETNIFPGPLVYDLTATDNIHLQTNASVHAAALRWWNSLNNTIYNTADNRGPRIENLSVSPERQRLIIDFYNDGNGLSVPGGTSYHHIYNGSTDETSSITYTKQTSTYQITIQLSKALTGTVKYSYALGCEAHGGDVINDNSSYSLPMEKVFNRTATNYTVFEQSNTTELLDMGNYNTSWHTDATFNDTLDDEPAGSHPDAWANDDQGKTADTWEISTTRYHGTPQKSIKLGDASTTGFIHHNDTWTTENITAWVYFPDTTKVRYICTSDTGGGYNTAEIMMHVRFLNTGLIDYYSGGIQATGQPYTAGWHKLTFHDNGNNTFDFWMDTTWVIQWGGYYNAGTTPASLIFGVSSGDTIYIDDIQIGTATSNNATVEYTTDQLYIPENTRINTYTISHRSLATNEDYIQKIEFIEDDTIKASYTTNTTTGTGYTLNNSQLDTGSLDYLNETCTIKIYYWSNTTTFMDVYQTAEFISNYTLTYTANTTKTHGGDIIRYTFYYNVSLEYSTVWINETYDNTKIQYHSCYPAYTSHAAGNIAWTLTNVNGSNIIYLNFTVNNTNTSYNLADNMTFRSDDMQTTATSNTVNIEVQVASIYAYIEIVKLPTVTGYNITAYGLIESQYSATIRVNCSESLGNINWYNISYSTGDYQNSSSPYYNVSWIGQNIGTGNITLTITTSANTTANQTIYIEVAAITAAERLEQTTNSFVGLLPLFIIVLFIGAMGDAFIKKKKK